MDIFLLFIFNIFTGAVIFLILSLKIEKTSSTFQEKKLRREMGEIITEFNSTAERNITLLENRISVLKKLLNENGHVKGIDFTVLDDKMKNNTEKSSNLFEKEKFTDKSEEKSKRRSAVENKIQIPEEQHNIIGTFLDKIQSFNITENAAPEKAKVKKSPFMENKLDVEKTYDSFSIIEKDIKDINIKKSRIDFSADEEITLSYENREEEEHIDIEDLFNNADDKYSLIARLFNEGHSVEELSKHSGLPAGEIKLVISLNS